MIFTIMTLIGAIIASFGFPWHDQDGVEKLFFCLAWAPIYLVFWLPLTLVFSWLMSQCLGKNVSDASTKSARSNEQVIADEPDEPEKEPKLWVIVLLAVVAAIVGLLSD